MKKILLLLATGLVLFSSCKERSHKDEFVISGKDENNAGLTILLQEMEVNGIRNLDSAIISRQGTFSFHYRPGDAGFYLLRAPSQGYILLLLEKGAHITISADFAEIPPGYYVEGSHGSELIKYFTDHTINNLGKADSLNSILNGARDTPDFYPLSVSFDSIFKILINDQREFERDFIVNNSNSLASLYVLYYKLGTKPVLGIETDTDLFELLDSTLTLAYPANKHVLFHRQRVAEFQREAMAEKPEAGKKRSR
jgi:hypothetical protein